MFGNQQAIDRLEARVREHDRIIDQLCAKLGIDRAQVDPVGTLDAQEQLLVQQGRPIMAIKEYRRRTGAGLREAKDVVDRFSGR
ncbi:hypothetical protein [Ornithinimicrobium panacihumi]|uniref:hypothetical protein n=1 Tax=Ornithinimicrobium panacihumi TaxID=2008449 RepID=UPI003F8BB1FC